MREVKSGLRTLQRYVVAVVGILMVMLMFRAGIVSIDAQQSTSILLEPTPSRAATNSSTPVPSSTDTPLSTETPEASTVFQSESDSRATANTARLYSARGDLYYYAGDYEQAIISYSQAIAIGSQSAITHSNRGIARVKLGNLEEAISDYTSAIELDPEYALAYLNRCVALAMQEDYWQALLDCNRAKELTPENADIYWALGNIYYYLNYHADALANYRLYVELADETPDISILALIARLESEVGEG